MENGKEKKGKIVVSFDDTIESVLELMEKLDIVELTFPPNVFFELPEDAKDKLTRDSLIKYGVAKRDAEATERTNKIQAEPGYQRLDFGSGSHVAGKMQVPKDDKKWHNTILNAKDVPNAKEQGYEVLGESTEKATVKNWNPQAKIEEEMVKMRISKEKYEGHMKAVSNDSRRRGKNRITKKGNSSIEMRREIAGIEVAQDIKE